MEPAVQSVSVCVEPAVPGDAPAILALHRRVLAEGQWFITEPDEFPEGVDAKVAVIRDAARSQNGVFLVARHQHALVGWAQVVGGGRRRTRHVGRLEMMVDARVRGVGVGSALLAAIIHWAEGSGAVYKLSLNVFAHNVRALALYEKYGFAEEGRRAREYRFADGSWRDDVLMFRLVK
ncbi:MAG: GNAT family N-acetyltransferase [Pseudomonadota bacterium]|nr:GNAT family N-acetyltransferase [Pseudomonadota bacterium]